jgi:pSer/pThr/pTyr-binding forkhead associated (FHA) protein
LKQLIRDEEGSAMSTQTFQMVMRAGPNPGKVYMLSKNEVVVGRDMNADVVINSAEVSRRHARLYLDGGIYVVEDLGSTNGTFINGQRLTAPTPLRTGDNIMLGEAAVLVFEITQFDPNATMIAPSGEPGNAMSAVPMSSAQQQVSAPGPQTYAGQVPAGPVSQQLQDGPPNVPSYSERRGGISWLWAGIGCVVVLLCILVVGLLIFDTLDLYCTPPFDLFDPFYQIIGGSCY